MVSEFVDEVAGYFRDLQDQVRLLLETQREGYFTNDLLMTQVARTVDIFERVHPEARVIFFFDNAPSHRKFSNDMPNADHMNVGPGGKQPKMRDTQWAGGVQKLVYEHGVPKGMKTVLEERGVDGECAFQPFCFQEYLKPEFWIICSIFSFLLLKWHDTQKLCVQSIFRLKNKNEDPKLELAPFLSSVFSF